MNRPFSLNFCSTCSAEVTEHLHSLSGTETQSDTGGQGSKKEPALPEKGSNVAS